MSGPLSQSSEAGWRSTVLISFVAVCVASLAAVFLNDSWAIFGGPDSFLRSALVRQAIETGNPFDVVYHRINFPDGHTLHWSRALNLLILAGAWPLSLLVDPVQAIILWGYVLPLLIAVGIIFSVSWMVRALLKGGEIPFALMIFLCYPAVISCMRPGYLDHHNLILAGYALVLGAGLRMLRNDAEVRSAIVGGLAGAVMLWVSVEGALPLVALSVVFALRWLVSPSPQIAAKGQAYALSLLVFSVVAMVIDVGFQVSLIPFAPGDQLSWLYVIVFTLQAVFWTVARLTSGMGVAARLGVAGVAGAVVVAAVGLINPVILHGVIYEVDPFYHFNRGVYILESEPILTTRHSLLQVLADLTLFIPFVFPGIAGMLYFLARDSEHRWSWGLLLVATLLVTGQHPAMPPRAGIFLGIVTLIGAAALISAGFRAVIGRLGWHAERPALYGSALLITFVLLFPAFAKEKPAEPSPAEQALRCDNVDLIAYLRAHPPTGQKPRAVVAFADFGPVTLMMTDYTVQSVPNHRDQPGFRRAHEIYAAATDRTAIDLLASIDAEWLVFCPERLPKEWAGFDAEGPTLSKRLKAGDVPGWLDRVADAGGPVGLYHVQLPPPATTGH